METGVRVKKTMENQRKPPTPLDRLYSDWTLPNTPLLKAEWTEMEGGRGEERKGGGGEKRGRRRERERGSGGNKDVSVPFPGTWPEMGGGKVCVWDLARNDQ